MSRAVWGTGLALMVAAVLVPTLMFTVGADSGDWEDAIAGIVFAFVLSPLLFVAGLVMLVVGLASGGGQQQQQQVVVVSGQGRARRYCTSCGAAMAQTDRFCTGCGMQV